MPEVSKRLRTQMEENQGLSRSTRTGLNESILEKVHEVIETSPFKKGRTTVTRPTNEIDLVRQKENQLEAENNKLASKFVSDR